MKKLFPNGIRIRTKNISSNQPNQNSNHNNTNYDSNQLNVHDLFDYDRMSSTTEVLCNNVYCNPIFNERFFDNDSDMFTDSRGTDSPNIVTESNVVTKSDSNITDSNFDGINFIAGGRTESIISDATSDAEITSFTGWSSPEPLSGNRRVSSITNVTTNDNAISDKSEGSSLANHHNRMKSSNQNNSSFIPMGNEMIPITHVEERRGGGIITTNQEKNGQNRNFSGQEHDEGRRGLKYESLFTRYHDREEEKERNQKRMKGRKNVTSSSYRFLRGRSAGSFYLKCGMAGEFY